MERFELFDFVKNRTFVTFYWGCLEENCHKKTEKDNDASKDKSKIHI